MAITTTPSTFLPKYTEAPEAGSYTPPALSPGADYPHLEPASAPSDEDLIKTALTKPTYTISVPPPVDAEEYNVPPPSVSEATLEEPRLEEQQIMSDLDTMAQYVPDDAETAGAMMNSAEEEAQNIIGETFDKAGAITGDIKEQADMAVQYAENLSEEAQTLVNSGKELLGTYLGLAESIGEGLSKGALALFVGLERVEQEQMVEKIWGVPPHEQGVFQWYTEKFQHAPYNTVMMEGWINFLFGDDVAIQDALNTNPEFRASLGYCFTYGTGLKADGSPLTGLEFRAMIIAGWPRAYGFFEDVWGGGKNAVLFAPEYTEEALAETKLEWAKLQPWYGEDPLEGAIRLMTPTELAAQAEKMKASVWYKTVTDSFIRNRLNAGWSMERINGTLPNYKIFMAFHDFQLATAAKQILMGIYPSKPASEIKLIVDNKLKSKNWAGQFRNQGANRQTAVWKKMINSINTQKPTAMCVNWNVISQEEANKYRDKFGISEAEIQAQYAEYVADLKTKLDAITTPLQEAIAVTGNEFIQNEETMESIMGMEGGADAAPSQLDQANIPAATMQTIMANNPNIKFAENAPSYRNPYTGNISRALFHSGHAFSPRWLR